MQYRLPFLCLVLAAFASPGAAEQLVARDADGLISTIIKLIRLIKAIIELLLEPPTIQPTESHTSLVPSATSTFVTSSSKPKHTVSPISWDFTWPHITFPHITLPSEPTSEVVESSSTPYVTITATTQSSVASPATHAPETTISKVTGAPPVTPAPAPETTISKVTGAPPVNPAPASETTISKVTGAPPVTPAPAPPASSAVNPGKPAPSPVETETLAPTQTAGSSSPSEPRCYKGKEFPAESEWASFETLFENNREMLRGFNSDDEIKSLHDSIESIAKADDLNPSLIFAIMLEESRGDCHVVAGDIGESVGIMQVHGCTINCHDVAKGQCSASKIEGMINCGVKGTDMFQGLKSCMNQNKGNVGAALRCYNSGSVPDPNDLSKGPGLPSYVSDVGNWVVGAQPPKDCDF